MTTLQDEVAGIDEVLETTSISKKKREEIGRFLGRITGYRVAGVVTAAEEIASPLVKAEAPYYWDYHDRETARRNIPLQKLRVDAANIASDPKDPNGYGHDATPNGWYPRVTVEIQAGARALTVDLTDDQARKFAIELLTASEVVSR